MTNIQISTKQKQSINLKTNQTKQDEACGRGVVQGARFVRRFHGVITIIIVICFDIIMDIIMSVLLLLLLSLY